MFHALGNNPITYTDPDGRAEFSRLKELAKEVHDEGSINGVNLYRECPSDGCFARATIIADELNKEGFSIQYIIVDSPTMPGKKEKFSYHISFQVSINEKEYVVDPYYSHDLNTQPGLTTRNEWIYGQNCSEATNEKAVNEKGEIIASSKFQGFYQRRKNPNQKPSEFASQWLAHFAKLYKNDKEFSKLTLTEKKLYIREYSNYKGE